jgi:hypothetical protein
MNIAVYGSVRQKDGRITAVKRLLTTLYFVVNDTTGYGRNTVAIKRAIHGPVTVVNIAFTAVYVNVHVRIRSFTFVVMMDLGVRHIIHIINDYFEEDDENEN